MNDGTRISRDKGYHFAWAVSVVAQKNNEGIKRHSDRERSTHRLGYWPGCEYVRPHRGGGGAPVGWRPRSQRCLVEGQGERGGHRTRPQVNPMARAPDRLKGVGGVLERPESQRKKGRGEHVQPSRVGCSGGEKKHDKESRKPRIMLSGREDAIRALKLLDKEYTDRD